MATTTREGGKRPGTIVQVFTSRKMAAILVLGFASGFPFYLTNRTLQAWMTVENVDLTTIGLFSLVALPYSLKFLWAPLLDRYVPPFLGRRRGWLVISQLALLLGIAAMALENPRGALDLLAFNALLIAFFSATQDIAFDAYKVDVLDERELGAGAAIGVLGYRIALLLTGSVPLILADRLSWPVVYALLALLMAIGVIASFWAPEPVMEDRPPQTLGAAIIHPFREFVNRLGPGRVVLVLAFIILYKLGDSMLLLMETPFLLKIGFTQTDIGAVQGVLGLGATMLGVLAGGAGIARWGLNRSLWIFGIVQSAMNISFYALAVHGHNYPLMVAAVVLENFFQGLGTGALVAFLMTMSSPRFSATQYALLSSLYAIGRDLLASPSGGLAEATGWPVFFLLTLLAAVPGLVLLAFIAPWNRDEPIGHAPHPGLVERSA